MRVLIVSTRYLGDCLIAASLATPIKANFPEAEVDLLTFESNRAIIEGVKGIDHVIGVKQHPKKLEQLKEMMGLKNRYDWAVITMQSTRASLYGYFAGKRQCMPKPDGGSHGLWKRWLMSDFVEIDHALPMIDQMASLLEPMLGRRLDPSEVPPAYPMNPNLPQTLVDWLGEAPYVVFHTQSRYRDKAWNDQGWRALTLKAIDRGLKVCFTGGPGKEEAARIAEITKLVFMLGLTRERLMLRQQPARLALPYSVPRIRLPGAPRLNPVVACGVEMKPNAKWVTSSCFAMKSIWIVINVTGIVAPCMSPMSWDIAYRRYLLKKW